MQGIIKEVLFVLNQILENICLEKDKLETERNCPLFMNKASNEGFRNFSRDEDKQSLILKASQEKFHQETKDDIKREKFNIRTSDDSIHYTKSSDCSWEEPLIKCDTSHAKQIGKFKDVFVQTIFHTPITIDSQCQCDLFSQKDTSMVLVDHRKKKEIKLNNHCYENVNYGKTHYQFQASEPSRTGSESFDNKTNYSDSLKLTSIFKSDSRLRIGLSKRFKPLPLHKR